MLERNRAFRFYQPELGCDLPHDPFKAIIAPRPIGWISTVDEHGRQNLAPYSYFNAVSTRPPAVMFSSEGVKDSVRNAMSTREFVCNLATAALAEAMNQSSANVPHEVNEFELDSPPRLAGWCGRRASPRRRRRSSAKCLMFCSCAISTADRPTAMSCSVKWLVSILTRAVSKTAASRLPRRSRLRAAAITITPR